MAASPQSSPFLPPPPILEEDLSCYEPEGGSDINPNQPPRHPQRVDEPQAFLPAPLPCPPLCSRSSSLMSDLTELSKGDMACSPALRVLSSDFFSPSPLQGRQGEEAAYDYHPAASLTSACDAVAAPSHFRGGGLVNPSCCLPYYPMATTTLINNRQLPNNRISFVTKTSAFSRPPVDNMDVPPVKRSRSNEVTSSLSREWRRESGKRYQRFLPYVETSVMESAETLRNHFDKERQHYQIPLAYVSRLQDNQVLRGWREGAVRWFVHVTENFDANYEVIGTSANLLDRYLAAETAALDQYQFKLVVIAALRLSCKMHQSDGSIAMNKIMPMTSVKVSPQVMANLEVHMSRRLGWYLNPPTAGVLIHHLLCLLPTKHRTNAMFVTLADHANDLALLALEATSFLHYPVAVVAVASILLAFTRLRWAGYALPYSLEEEWRKELRSHGVSVCECHLTSCLQLFHVFIDPHKGLSNKNLDQTPDVLAYHHQRCGLNTLSLESFLRPFTVHNPFEPQSPLPPTTPIGVRSRAVSPTGVDEIDLIDGGCPPPLPLKAQRHHPGMMSACYPPLPFQQPGTTRFMSVSQPMDGGLSGSAFRYCGGKK